ncbi:winged helix-turn-helix domain-containing protein [Streptomyces avicenniae]|uniref:winged helix-turn-helix domain-containing protein n=1 Tax=Streptomyces avicenniae TaxID=500153 RepID=UPI00069A33E2|nr:winged helix-turn-helix domain-containing protein [Streptomyces avicenniae]
MTGQDAHSPPEGFDPRYDVALDARGLRALAHPLRIRLLGLLRGDGPATATGLAQRTGLSSGATSYHLRQLAAAGFVAEDTARGTGRERWWRSVHRRTAFNDMDVARSEPEATLAYLLAVAASHAERTEAAIGSLQTMPAVWQESVGLTDVALRLTPEETGALRRDLREVVARYRRDLVDEPVEAPPGAERVTVIVEILPDPALPSPEHVR